jgi:two-component system chemotaxis sensor kinase CheA
MARDPYKYFRVEARELLDQLGHGVLDLEKGPAQPEGVSRLFRLAHTLKGAARVVKQSEIADRAHALEDTLAPLRQDAGLAATELTNRALGLIDEMSSWLAQLAPAREVPSERPLPAAEEPPPRMLGSDLAEVDTLLDGISEASAQMDSVRMCLSRTERARRLAQLLDEQLGALRIQRTLNGSGARLRSFSSELRALIEGVERELGFAVEQAERELAQVRESAEHLRMVRASVMIHPLERTARDAAAALKRRVAFSVSGAELRMDAQLLNVVQSALVQVIRNAIAHGIESEADRRAAGKTAEGQIALAVRRQGNQLAFSCRDDGRGIDFEAVRRAAVRSGKLAEGQVLDRSALLELLLGGGISTARSVTEISGRGVGLDVIGQVVRELRGQVHVDTVPGKGTTFELVVPVSLAALRALILEVNSRVFAVPLDAVARSLRIRAEDMLVSAEGTSVLFEGEAIPFLSLASALREPERADSRSVRSAVVIQRGEKRAALGVDRLRGTENIVMRPLPPFTPADAVIAGATLDSAGRAQLVIDADCLLRRAEQAKHVTRPARERLPILVIDDSLTTRMLEQSILEAAGYEVDVATSGEEGLEKAKRRRYALFLVDVEMPGMDGFTFIEKTQSDPALAPIPAILLTSRGSSEDRARGVAAGARDHMLKSEFDQGVLLDRIRSLVDGS